MFLHNVAAEQEFVSTSQIRFIPKRLFSEKVVLLVSQQKMFALSAKFLV